MTGRSCRRLLAGCSLIFTSISISSTFVASIVVASILVASILVAPTFLRGQSVAADRSPGSDPAISHALAPNLAPPNLASPNLTPPSLAPLRDSSPIAPVWIPPPSLPQTYPVSRYPGRYSGTVIFQQMVRAAGIIFSGRVTSIGRTPSSIGASAGFHHRHLPG